MSDSNRTRLEVQNLDDRTVPSTVTATETARPFDFVATGTLTTTTVNTEGPVAVTSSATANITVNGLIDYSNAAQGSVELASFSGTGTGNETPVNVAELGGRGAYAQTVQGLVSIADNGGVVNSLEPLTGTANWLTPAGGSGIDLLGPQSLDGSFDTSTFKLQTGWTSAANIGNISVTLAGKTNVATDLGFGDSAAALALDGSLTLDFTALITGNLMHAATHDSAATSITAVWQGDNGETEDAELSVAINWNTGTVAVHAEGLTPPEWAKRLTVKLDAANLVSEGNENNNTWTVELSDLLPPLPPPPPPPPPPVASYSIVPAEPLLQMFAASGQVIAQRPAMEGFSGQVSLATGDMNGDGILDVAIAAGSGGGPRVRMLDGRTGLDLANIFAYDSEFRGGVRIALGDVDGDGKVELVTGSGEGGGPHVRVIDPLTGVTIREFFAYNPETRGGVVVATGDLEADGRDEIITAPGAGAGGYLLVIDGATGTERYSVMVTDDLNDSTVKVVTAVDPITGATVVNVIPDNGNPLLKFRSQMAAGEPLLVAIPTDPVLFDPLLVA